VNDTSEALDTDQESEVLFCDFLELEKAAHIFDLLLGRLCEPSIVLSSFARS